MVDARSVGDDDRRAVVSLGLADCLEALCVIGTHSHLGNIDVTVGGGNQTQVFLADALAGSSKLGDSADGCSLRGLTAGVAIDLGVNDQDVDVLARCDDVVQTAEADVVACAVATDDPLRTLDQILAQALDLEVGGVVAVLDGLENLVAELTAAGTVVAVVHPLLV